MLVGDYDHGDDWMGNVKISVMMLLIMIASVKIDNLYRSCSCGRFETRQLCILSCNLQTCKDRNSKSLVPISGAGVSWYCVALVGSNLKYVRDHHCEFVSVSGVGSISVGGSLPETTPEPEEGQFGGMLQTWLHHYDHSIIIIISIIKFTGNHPENWVLPHRVIGLPRKVIICILHSHCHHQHTSLQLLSSSPTR